MVAGRDGPLFGYPEAFRFLRVKFRPYVAFVRCRQPRVVVLTKISNNQGTTFRLGRLGSRSQAPASLLAVIQLSGPRPINRFHRNQLFSPRTSMILLSLVKIALRCASPWRFLDSRMRILEIRRHSDVFWRQIHSERTGYAVSGFYGFTSGRGLVPAYSHTFNASNEWWNVSCSSLYERSIEYVPGWYLGSSCRLCYRDVNPPAEMARTLL